MAQNRLTLTLVDMLLSVVDPRSGDLLKALRPYERINGAVLEADDCQRLSGTGCQQGLALGHPAAWRRAAERRLPAALVLEDDVAWHSDLKTLLPRYLAAAPRDWRVIWLGQLRREGMGAARWRCTATTCAAR